VRKLHPGRPGGYSACLGASGVRRACPPYTWPMKSCDTFFCNEREPGAGVKFLLATQPFTSMAGGGEPSTMFPVWCDRTIIRLISLKKQEDSSMASPRFEKGISGNPLGRKPGKTPGAKIRKAIELRADDILQAVIDSAVQGDMTACKMLLDRITPVLKPQSIPITLPSNGTLLEKGNEVIKAMLSGQIPTDTGSQLITALGHQLKIVEVDELTRRIEALEATK
jgi:hypothetical protein